MSYRERVGKGSAARRRSTIGVIAVAVLGLGLVAGTSVAGPLRAGPPRWLPTTGRPPVHPAAPVPAQSGAPTAVPQDHFSPAVLQQWLFWAALAAVITAGILVYLVRRALRRARVRSQEQDARLSPVTSPPPPSRTDEPVAPVVARGIDRALQLLDDVREPRDAIVRAWLGLQDAAEASGASRRASETPGEYTTRIVTRFGTDRNAALTLLDLYQGVRFGGHPVDGTTVELARSCLTRLRDSWHDSGPRVGGPAPIAGGAGTQDAGGGRA